MNKPICIFLCILLIILSVVPVFASDYYFSSVSDFVNTTNPLITADYNFFVSSVPSNYVGAYNNAIEHYGIDTSKIIVTAFSYYSTNNYTARIYVSDSPMLYCYADRVSNVNYTPYLTSYWYPDQVITWYSCRYNVSTNVVTNYNTGTYTTTASSRSLAPDNNNKGAFDGFLPNKLKFSPISSVTNMYILGYPDPDNPGGGGGGSTSYEYIEMDKPPTVYGNLWTTLHNGAWDDVAATYPSVYQNVTRGEFMFSDTSPGMNANNIFSAINVCGVLFESYMAHSYDFYDNISYNLATWMNTTQSLSEDIGKLVEVYASDQEVAAREAAAENQQAIVDNFLDSEGEGYVSPSDISSVSSMSDGYKTHMSTDAQPSGIWDIFNSNNFGWFSQETVNQLDTSTSNQRGSNIFETPYLNEKIRDIYKSLGVNYDD